MSSKKQIGQAILSILLLVVLLLPTGIQFSHSFEHHEHTSCNNKQTHLHQNVQECKICDFHLTSFSYQIPEYTQILNPEIFFNTEEYLPVLFFNFHKKTNTQLRAPPHSLV
ncbi:hypothetical protein [uncultured Algibacter sp.]|uniref:hypothetical protein n=1 Tax=uncultured Algibacter sp. TaxID=298659 RepID=UPI0032164158